MCPQSPSRKNKWLPMWVCGPDLKKLLGGNKALETEVEYNSFLLSPYQLVLDSQVTTEHKCASAQWFNNTGWRSHGNSKSLPISHKAQQLHQERYYLALSFRARSWHILGIYRQVVSPILWIKKPFRLLSSLQCNLSWNKLKTKTQ